MAGSLETGWTFLDGLDRDQEDFEARVQQEVDLLCMGQSPAAREQALLADLNEAQERIEFLEQFLSELRQRAAERRDWTLISLIEAGLRKE